jgi:aldose 1-epimerase
MPEADDAVVLAAADGTVTATIHPTDGGRLAQIDVGGRRLLKDRDDREQAWAFWGCYPLIPWSNRIADARFRFAGRVWHLDERWVDGTAIHGLVNRAPWRVVDRPGADNGRLTLAIDLHRAPWDLACTQRFALSHDRLELGVTVGNIGATASPVGIGIHPWFRAGVVVVPADRIWPAAQSIPTGPPRPVRPEEDLREGAVPPPTMDDCFTGLSGKRVGLPDLELAWTGPVEQVVVYGGEPGWVALEPVTNANDGFNLMDAGVDGHGVIVLEPGASTGVTYTFRWA